ncbi:hypothetical protein FNH05_24510 [Amycolatopsis rhizosphaerae]|uniref:DUF4118 domain-containing protein n=1 Tax=Amycolatopsis rhizosphaerae TaxID=2053003 RepID=A0A558BNR3_9PSEU|nr:hypothetical protein [Amycolatopsis rhizosphaerae]TVT38133.1 hypothetical protein FNH05_24510 [Amycolatopsis rhizosphaerae]
MRRTTTPVPGGFGFPLGFAVTMLVALAAIAAGAVERPWVVLALLAVALAAVAALTTPAAALGTAVFAWCLHDGFVLGRAGDLVFTPASGRAALVLAGVAIVVPVVAAAARAARRGLTARASVPSPRSAADERTARPSIPT